MKAVRPALFALAVSVAISGQFVRAQEVFMNPRSPGVKYCPVPGRNNSEFIDTHFGIDAKTGQLTKYTGTVHPDETGMAESSGEQVLYVAPPVSVENRYVPPAGSTSRTPPETYGRPLAAAPAVSRSRPAPPAPSRTYSPQQTRSAQQQPARVQQSAPARSSNVAYDQPQAKQQPAIPPARQNGQVNGKRPWWKAIFK